MKAVIFEEHGPVSNLKVADIPAPEPAAGEALVRVRAVALNGFDPMILAKIPGINTPLPMIPGGDISGEVAGFGPGTDAGEFAVGTRVLIDPLIRGKGVFGETVRGGACEYVTVPVTNLVRVPDAVSFEDAAALPIAYGTAYRMIRERGKVLAGEKVLVLGATGGVGVCSVQLAKLAGAEVAAATSSAAKAEQLRAIGVDHVINVAEEDFVKSTQALWGKPRVFDEGGGADVVVNFVGGDDWARALRCVKRGGRMLTCGATNGYDPKTDIRFIWSFEISVVGSNCWTRGDLVALLDLVADGSLKPQISSLRPLEELPTSLQDMIDRTVFGKAVLRVA
ncbi:zinc-binding dehydrogenase [Azorhizobium oxalatiphilum]|uniref:Zinc-binding dehydrogenase n=1 Tax=Azorhizobium oxalatiphilum TaxID=980631 RepID=A0A917F9L3_9HYPH|nr:zinc-binding dehydrogenase [Azorhizobium oxalatiphilum]GGF58565.1 zinc-binding dehydrogenase [Azorhizobium oxalatiphilum]